MIDRSSFVPEQTPTELKNYPQQTIIGFTTMAMAA
jgi:hypothetical protein